MSGPPSITCPVCERTSYNPSDIREGYCGNCHDWTGAERKLVGKGPSSPGMFYDKQGVEISLARYTWLWDPSRFQQYRQVAVTDVEEFRVSTVWLGVNMAFMSGPPIGFETMTFLRGDSTDLGMQRYSTLEEARAGHEAIVAEIRVLASNAAVVQALVEAQQADRMEEPGMDLSVSDDAMRWQPE